MCLISISKLNFSNCLNKWCYQDFNVWVVTPGCHNWQLKKAIATLYGKWILVIAEPNASCYLLPVEVQYNYVVDNKTPWSIKNSFSANGPSYLRRERALAACMCPMSFCAREHAHYGSLMWIDDIPEGGVFKRLKCRACTIIARGP